MEGFVAIKTMFELVIREVFAGFWVCVRRVVSSGHLRTIFEEIGFDFANQRDRFQFSDSLY